MLEGLQWGATSSVSNLLPYKSLPSVILCHSDTYTAGRLQQLPCALHPTVNCNLQRKCYRTLFCVYSSPVISKLDAGSEQQSSSPLELIQQLRQKLAVHLPSTQHHDKLKEGCLLLQVAAAHGKEDALPAPQHCFSEADLVCQVTSCSLSQIVKLHRNFMWTCVFSDFSLQLLYPAVSNTGLLQGSQNCWMFSLELCICCIRAATVYLRPMQPLQRVFPVLHDELLNDVQSLASEQNR